VDSFGEGVLDAQPPDIYERMFGQGDAQQPLGGRPNRNNANLDSVALGQAGVSADTPAGPPPILPPEVETIEDYRRLMETGSVSGDMPSARAFELANRAGSSLPAGILAQAGADGGQPPDEGPEDPTEESPEEPAEEPPAASPPVPDDPASSGVMTSIMNREKSAEKDDAYYKTVEKTIEVYETIDLTTLIPADAPPEIVERIKVFQERLDFDIKELRQEVPPLENFIAAEMERRLEDERDKRNLPPDAELELEEEIKKEVRQEARRQWKNYRSSQRKHVEQAIAGLDARVFEALREAASVNPSIGKSASAYITDYFKAEKNTITSENATRLLGQIEAIVTPEMIKKDPNLGKQIQSLRDIAGKPKRALVARWAGELGKAERKAANIQAKIDAGEKVDFYKGALAATMKEIEGLRGLHADAVKELEESDEE
jgi:hypothetical protein